MENLETVFTKPDIETVGTNKGFVKYINRRLKFKRVKRSRVPRSDFELFGFKCLRLSAEGGHYSVGHMALLECRVMELKQELLKSKYALSKCEYEHPFLNSHYFGLGYHATQKVYWSYIDSILATTEFACLDKDTFFEKIVVFHTNDFNDYEIVVYPNPLNEGQCIIISEYVGT